ncbi:MAG TPA: DEAD/DEAH box helicase [Opitutaceae bacterium]
MLRIFVPPNLPATAPKDSIALRVDLDLPPAPAMPAPEVLPALALLQKWLGSSSAPPPRLFLQVNRSQMSALVTALRGQPLFAWANAPDRSIAWAGAELAGVSTFLSGQPAASAAASVGNSPTGKPAVTTPPRRPMPAAGRMNVDGSEHFLAITLPHRDHPTYARALELLKAWSFLPEPSNGKWWQRDRHKTLSFLAEMRPRLETDFGATFTPGFLQRTAHVAPAQLEATATEAGGAYDVTIGLRAEGATDSELRTALLTGRPYAEAGGKVILLGPETLAKLSKAQQALSGDPSTPLAPRQSRRIPAARAAEADELLAEAAPGFQPPETWKARSSALKQISSLKPAPLPERLDERLRPYQRLGVAWLWHLFQHDLGGILADEMGLGKTLQALALLLAARGHGSALVVCPASLLENWRREAERFAPDLRVFVHHGGQRLASARDVLPFDLVITSYGTLVRDESLFQEAALGCVIADEAQHLKNRRSQNARALRALHARGRFLLTGTPLENSLDDLRSLFDFILPGYIAAPSPGARGTDRAWFDDRLKAQAAPYILRRTKAAVAPELPPRIEQVVWCELTPEQAALYRQTQEAGERALIDLEAGGASEGQVRFAALTQLLRLRQICCDPRLVKQDDVDSGKLETLRELLAESLDDGHRILLFSQFTSLLELLREELERQEIAYCYLDGSMPTAARQEQVDRFQGSDECPVFLLSLKAGGTGLNLTGADTVVHYDPWWNPAAELQATDRAHRIGQNRTVTSYKLIASGTVEERVLGLQAEKRALLEAVFDASDAAAAKLSLADLKSLLKSQDGAHGPHAL